MRRVIELAVAFLIGMNSIAMAAEQTDKSYGAWLGVRLTPVPPALVAHLQLKDQGVMISNVFNDSPADNAGIERYDVIVEVDGKPVEDDAEKFTKHIRSKKPGDSIELTIYHQAARKNLTIKLDERRHNWDDLDMKYEEEPEAAPWWERGIRGKILRPGPHGWELKDLGEIPELRNLPNWSDLDSMFFYNEDEVDEGRRVDKDGNVLHVHREKGDKIVVKRYREGEDADKAEVKTYESMEKLKEADPEAYDLLRSVGPRYPWLEQYQDALRKYKDSWRKYREVWPKKWDNYVGPDYKLPEKWQDWHKRFFQGPLKNLLEPQIRFDVSADGQVTVHLQDEDAELNKTFKSKEDLKAHAPELYERLEKMEQKLR